jgi:hypothetical protein
MVGESVDGSLGEARERQGKGGGCENGADMGKKGTFLLFHRGSIAFQHFFV